MRCIEFSDKSVELAKAAKLLGFDTIEKYKETKCGGKVTITIPHIRMRNTKVSCELNALFFPELEFGEDVDINYIINFKECNEIYKKYGSN